MPLLSASLKYLSLRGQFIQDHAERLLGKVQFCLHSLNLEDCGLTGADMAFLGRSKQRISLRILKAGGLDLGKYFPGLVQMLKGMKQVSGVTIFF